MLKPEQARKELEHIHREDGEKRRLAALARLPKPLAEIGRGLLGRDPRGRAVEPRTAHWQAQVLLEALPARERRPLFEALFPHLGTLVDGAWDLTFHLPYETAFDRRVFRAPHEPAVTRRTRANWFESLLHELNGYEGDLPWLAAWAGYLNNGYSADAAGLVLAAALNAGGKEGDAVFDILCNSARGRHPVGTLGRHVFRAFLIASRPEGWEFVGQLLLASLDQEGLFQSILEAMEEAHPEAFRRLLRLIQENDLVRFGPTVRALNGWFGLQWDVVSPRVANRVLDRAAHFLEEPQAQANALENNDSETVYLALWTMAFEDAPATVAPTAAVLWDPSVERRFIAIHLLSQLHLPAARVPLVRALDDGDLRVALCALEGLEAMEDENGESGDKGEALDLFNPLSRLLNRIPEKKSFLEPIVWPWQVFSCDRETVAASLHHHLGQRPPSLMIPHMASLESGERRSLIEQLAGPKRWDDQTREALLALVGDPSITVREAAIRALEKCKLDGREAIHLEELLGRKAGDLRRGVLSLLCNQKDGGVLASADRLLNSPEHHHRQAGLELLRLLVQADRLRAECRERAEEYQASRPRLGEEELQQLDGVLNCKRPAHPRKKALARAPGVSRGTKS